MAAKLGAAVCCCLVVFLTLVYLPQDFIPAATSNIEVPRDLRTAMPASRLPSPGGEAGASSTSYVTPLALGLALGVALALPRVVNAATPETPKTAVYTGNLDTAAWVETAFVKGGTPAGMGALGIEGLSWNAFYAIGSVLTFGAVFVLPVLGAFLMPRPREMVDGKYK
eukprot:TRINITY_DN3630_c0_g1_i2.p2 TRINITY_DN3630_c0_g1~~TRINITY_DN3630_c0_g1_i2.p2  ORF type:complete len:188 (-),score=24.73 TRINITY_DN3630_c0_g1_i2:306-809(-)